MVAACLPAYPVRCPRVNVDQWAMRCYSLHRIAIWAIDDQGQPTRRGGPFRSALCSRNGRRRERLRGLLFRGALRFVQHRPLDGPSGQDSIGIELAPEMKTNKHKTLLLAKSQGAVTSRDLMRKYDYSAGTARSYLSHLGRQGLLHRANDSYVLTEKGHSHMRYFAIFVCRRPRVPSLLGEAGASNLPPL